MPTFGRALIIENGYPSIGGNLWELPRGKSDLSSNNIIVPAQSPNFLRKILKDDLNELIALTNIQFPENSHSFILRSVSTILVITNTIFILLPELDTIKL